MSGCPWCHHTAAVPLFSRRDRLGEDTFSYLRCAQCGLVRLDPRPSQEALSRYYPADYEAFQERAENWLFRLGRHRAESRRLHAIRRHLSTWPGRALDVGCATGDFLALLQRHGWSVAGIEPHAAGAARAAQRLGPGAVQALPLEEAVLPERSFHLITLWDVLEHLPDPPGALVRLAHALAPSGLLVLGVPNLDSWDAHLFGRNWIGWDAPRHLFLFPDTQLRAMLAAAGLEVVTTRCFYGDYGAWILSLDLALRQRFGARPFGPALRHLAALRPWRYLLWPYFRLAERCDRGPVRTYFCRPSR